MSLDVELALKDEKLAEHVSVEEVGEVVVVKPKRFLGEVWHKVNAFLWKRFDAEWVSVGKESHWKIMLQTIMKPKVIPISEMMPKPKPLGIESEDTYKQPGNAIQTPKQPQTNELAETFALEGLGASSKVVGQIYPVVKDQFGNILDGFHRKRIDPNWKETTVEVTDPLQALRIRVHANILRRNIDWKEKHEWVMEARKLLNPNDPMQVTQEEIAKDLGFSRSWVEKYETKTNIDTACQWKTNFYGYNVWGFENENWRKFISKGDPNQPDKKFYHGSTPAFVIHQLIQMFQPKTVLDNMAGVGTTGYVCTQYEGIECDQFDIYPYPKYDVQQGDAASIKTDKKYDLIFNHIPYWRMVKYGENPNDLSTMTEEMYFAKLKTIFEKNHELLNDNGVFAVLVGDWRHGGKLVPITAFVIDLALEVGFELFDEAVKLTAEQRSTSLQEYRAAKFGYLAQTFDTVLIFKKVYPNAMQN